MLVAAASRIARALPVRRRACLHAARSLATSQSSCTPTNAASTTSSQSPSPDPGLVDFSAADAELNHSDVAVYRDFVTQHQHDALLQQLTPVFTRRRYEKGHWDAVIEDYKESERADDTWDATSMATIQQIRSAANIYPSNLNPWLPVHAIDLSASGFIRPHVDSIKFSGRVVAGLSLVSAAQMVLRRVTSDGTPHAGGSTVRLLLPPRSFYVLQGAARYHYTHEIEPPDEGGGISWRGEKFPRGRRLSLIFRDSLVDVSGHAKDRPLYASG